MNLNGNKQLCTPPDSSRMSQAEELRDTPVLKYAPRHEDAFFA